LSLDDAKKAFAGLDKVTVQLLMPSKLRQRAREIAEQFNLRAVYDATYAALAELHGCEFWTADKVFYDTVSTVFSFVKYLPDYP
jgi:predicted nucleic acid-binding protein